jgi:hypothetical protein
MFADGSRVPYERTRRLIQKLAAPLKATPLRISIVGRAGTKRLWGIRSFGGPGQRRAADSREGRIAAGPHFRGLRKSGQPATLSRRSLAVGEPARDHHADA